jgi:hypothetical protein
VRSSSSVRGLLFAGDKLGRSLRRTMQILTDPSFHICVT